jgi:cupin superfamily acireductone dioxygenase involved in methionine salvage
MGMTIDPAIRIGDFITLAFFLVGGLSFAWSMRADLKMLARDVNAQGLKIDKLEAVITAQAVQGQRMDDLDRRIEEMRHGRGFIQRDINGLYGQGGKAQNLT